MSQVDFHTGLGDKLPYACRLLRKAQASGARIGVLAPPDVLDALDVALWRFSATDFVAHCRADAPPAMRAASPIVLAQDCAALDADRVLLHLGRELPDGFERFARLIELVGAERAQGVQYAEAFEGCEYGARLTPDNMRRLFPFFG